MPDGDRIRLAVVLDYPGDPICGTLDDGRGSIAFTGWLELMSAFDIARARAGGRGSEPADETDAPSA